jgi:hypothetical protein
MFDLAVGPDIGFGKKAFGLGAIESRMHTGYEVQNLRNLYPAWQNGDVGNEADIAHEPIALLPRIAPEHPQLALVWDKTEDRIEGGGLACAIRTYNSEDAALLDTQINAVERDRRAEGLA